MSDDATLKQGRPAVMPRRATTIDGDLAEAIVRMVITRPLAPGTPLRENELAIRFGVSRPTVRAALRAATTTGFVEITAFRGAHVRRLGARDLADLINLLEDSYGLAAREAARHRNDQDIRRLNNFMARFDDGFSDDSNPDSRIRQSFRFGTLVGAASHSYFIQDALERCGRLVLWQQRLCLADVIWFEQQSLAFHRLLAWAIEHRNEAAACDAGRAIIRLTREAFHDSKIL